MRRNTVSWWASRVADWDRGLVDSLSLSSLFLNVDRTIRDPGRVLVRILGLTLPVVVGVIQLVFGTWSRQPNLLITWVASYLAYVVALEVLRVRRAALYESAGGRALRVGFNVALITWLIGISPGARLVLWPFFLLPTAAAILYFDNAAATGVTILAGGAGLYTGGIALGEPPHLDTVQVVGSALSLGLFGGVFHFMLRKSLQVGRVLEMARDLRGTTNLTQLLTVALEHALVVTGADRALIIIVEPKTRRFFTWQRHNLELRDNRSAQEFADRCTVLRQGAPFSCRDAVEAFGDKSLYKRFFRCEPRSMLGEPLFDRTGRLLGTVSVTHDAPDHFDRRSRELLQLLSHLVGSAAENSLHLRQERLRDAATKTVSQELAGATTEEEVAQVLITEARRLVPQASAAVLHRLNRRTGELIPWQASPMEAASLGKTPMSAGSGVAGHVLEIREPVVVRNVAEHPWFCQTDQAGGIRSIAVAPLVDGATDEMLGTLSVHSRERDAFDGEDEFKLAALSCQGARALAKACELSGALLHRDLLERILEAALGLDTLQDEDALCQQIADSAREVLGFGMSRLRLYDPDRDDFVTKATAGIPADAAAAMLGQRVPRRDLERLFAPAFKAGRCYFIPANDPVWDSVPAEHFYTAPPQDYGPNWHADNALLAVLEAEPGAVQGCLSLDLPCQGQFPSDQALDAIGVFAVAASWAIERARAHRRITRQRQRTERFLKAVSRDLARSRELDAIGEVVVRAGADLIGAEGCSLHLVQDGLIRLAYSSHLVGTPYIGREKPITDAPGCGLVAWAAAHKEIMRFRGEEFKLHPAWAGEEQHLKYIESKACRSLLYIPVVTTAGQVIGVLQVENKTGPHAERGFDDDDQAMLQYMADLVESAIEKVRRYEVARKWERAGLEDDIHELVNWYHAGVFLGLETIEEWCRRGRHDRALEILPGVIHRANTTLTELKTVHTSVFSRYLETDDVETGLHRIAEAWILRTGREVPIVIEVDIDQPLSALATNILLRIAVGAVGNALLHSGVHEMADGRIWVKLTRRNGQTDMEVGDNGRGIAADIPEGYGIVRMRKLAEQIAGEIVIATSPGKGTTIKLGTHDR